MVALVDSMDAHLIDEGTVCQDVSSLGGGDSIVGSQNTDLTAVVHGRIAQCKYFKLQQTKY